MLKEATKTKTRVATPTAHAPATAGKSGLGLLLLGLGIFAGATALAAPVLAPSPKVTCVIKPSSWGGAEIHMIHDDGTDWWLQLDSQGKLGPNWTPENTRNNLEKIAKVPQISAAYKHIKPELIDEYMALFAENNAMMPSIMSKITTTEGQSTYGRTTVILSVPKQNGMIHQVSYSLNESGLVTNFTTPDEFRSLLHRDGVGFYEFEILQVMKEKGYIKEIVN